jgi:TolB-like protein/Tfp pilus assembly protein PilF
VSATKLLFGDFELDTAACELRRQGRRIRLERIPMDLLLLLVERRGSVVTRDEIVDRLWGKDIFVDTENNINAAMRKIRKALKDTPDRPAFVRTITGRGYCFIAPVTAQQDQKTDLSPAIAKPVVMAVLPFENLTSDSEQEYFSDGLTEETISAVGKVNPNQLAVIARTSCMLYKKTSKTAAQIGHELGADYLLESSVRREADRIRVTAKLIRVQDQSQIWAESYDRTGPGAIAIQEELGIAIAREVTTGVALQRPAKAQRFPTLEVYDLYLRGKYTWSQRTQADVRNAIEYFKLAAAKDPNYAPVQAHLAIAYTGLPINSDGVPLDALRRARPLADEALRLDANLAEAHAAAGYIDYFLEWDWERAEQSLRRAIQLNPNYDFPHVMLAHILTRTGRPTESAAEMARARQLDPLSASVHALAGHLLFESGKFKEAIEPSETALGLNANLWIAHLVLGEVYERTGRTVEAIRELDRAFESSNNSKPLAIKGYILARSGRRAEAENIIQMFKSTSRERFVPPYNIALVYAGLGDRDAVWEWLNRAYDSRDVHMVHLPVDGKWDDYRMLPQFQELVRRCGFAKT